MTAVRAVFGLGSNLGERLNALQSAVDVICADPRVAPVAVSRVVETDPVGGPQQPDYLNAVLIVETTLSPIETLALAQVAEELMGRDRGERWAARTLDVDVLAYGDVVSDDPILTLPHPRATKRAFVLVPWADADPEYRIAGSGRTVSQQLAALGATGIVGVRSRDDVSLELPSGHTLVP